MTPKERAIKAFSLEEVDYVPTLELDFQLTEELWDEHYYTWPEAVKSGKSMQEMLEHNASLLARVADHFDYVMIMITSRQNPIIDPDNMERNTENLLTLASLVRGYLREERLIFTHGDATYAIPAGDKLLDFVYDLSDNPEDMKEQAAKMVKEKLEECRRLIDGGFDGFSLCADYAFNLGPFLSPGQFSEFVTPYLAGLIEGQRDMGALVIKHTDGNIMPIIDQIVGCNPHALHSLDPQGQIDIKRVKALYGKKVCLIGNVNCGLLQTGTKEEILESARYALENGKPGGGYIFSTSNVAYKGMPLSNYQLIHDYYLQHRKYQADSLYLPAQDK